MSTARNMDAVFVFDAVARHSSFKKAAAELGVTQAAVSHRIAALEGQLGVALFERRTRSIALTREGASLYAATTLAFPAIVEALDTLAGRRRDELVVSATTAFALHWLVPRLARAAELQAAPRLSVHADEAMLAFEPGAAQIAIRYGPVEDDRDIAVRTLGRDCFVPVCSPLYAQSLAQGASRLTLIQFDWHRADRLAPSWSRFREENVDWSSSEEAIHLSDEASAISAALAGQGVALASSWVASDHLLSGSLRIAGPGRLEGNAISLVTRARPAAAVLRVRDWLDEEFVQARATHERLSDFVDPILPQGEATNGGSRTS